MIRKIIKRILLKKKGIDCDSKSNINLNVKISKIREKNSKVIDSQVHLTKIGGGCFLEHVYAYGNIELGDYVSISGPGTIIHSEIGKISIGSFTSIAENVSIQEFNHHQNKIAMSAVHYHIFHENVKKDFLTKGDIIIEEDVWIGSNSVILSGVTIGRGAIVGAGSVVTKNIPRYAIAVGNPATVIRYRFPKEKILELENLRWWLWKEEEFKIKKTMFENPF